MERYNPRVCLASSAWPMMLNFSNGNELAQDGWTKRTEWSTTTPYYFYEYGTSSELKPPMMIEAVPDSTDHEFDHFAVYTQKSETEVLFTINGVGEATVPLDWKADGAEYSAGVHVVGDQVAGDTSDHHEFYGLRHLYDGEWYSDNAEGNTKFNSASYGKAEFPDGNYFYTWDSRYSSEE